MGFSETTALPFLTTEKLLRAERHIGHGNFRGENGEVFDSWAPNPFWEMLSTRFDLSNTVESIASARATIELQSHMGYNSLATNWSIPDNEAARMRARKPDDSQASNLATNDTKILQSCVADMMDLKAERLQARAEKISMLIQTAQPFLYVCGPTLTLNPVYLGRLSYVTFMRDNNDSTLRPVLQDTDGIDGILPVEFDTFTNPLCGLRSDQ